MIFPRVPGLVSIVVPSYNDALHVIHSLESLRQQTYAEIELIIVDDASTDRTQLKIEAWLQMVQLQSPTITTIFLKLPRHIGYAGALTTAFFLSQGEYIAIQRTKDLSVPTRIEKQVNYLTYYSDHDLVGTNVEIFDDGHFDLRLPSDWIEYGVDIKNSYVLGRPALHLSSVMFRGEVFDCVGGLVREPLEMEEMLFTMKFLAHETVVNNIPEVLYYARTTQETLPSI